MKWCMKNCITKSGVRESVKEDSRDVECDHQTDIEDSHIFDDYNRDLTPEYLRQDEELQ